MLTPIFIVPRDQNIADVVFNLFRPGRGIEPSKDYRFESIILQMVADLPKSPPGLSQLNQI